jgi:hypothetical protein
MKFIATILSISLLIAFGCARRYSSPQAGRAFTIRSSGGEPRYWVVLRAVGDGVAKLGKKAVLLLKPKFAPDHERPVRE